LVRTALTLSNAAFTLSRAEETLSNAALTLVRAAETLSNAAFTLSNAAETLVRAALTLSNAAETWVRTDDDHRSSALDRGSYGAGPGRPNQRVDYRKRYFATNGARMNTDGAKHGSVRVSPYFGPRKC
jgi:hypothetical protein